MSRMSDIKALNELIEARIRRRFTILGRGLLVAAAVVLILLAGMYVARPHPRGSLPMQQVVRRIDVNRADAGELALLPGIGPTLADRIVEHRQRRGEFRSVEQLQGISGFGPATMASVRPYVYCTPVATPAPAPSSAPATAPATPRD